MPEQLFPLFKEVYGKEYPEGIKAAPDHLQCRILFQDNSEHIYQIPTIKVQSYSLEEIRELKEELAKQETEIAK